jgi:hypothetical protein
VQRWLFHEWVIVVRRGGRGRTTLIDYQSFKAAYQRLLNGEEPPLLPSEERPKCVPKARGVSLYYIASSTDSVKLAVSASRH